MPPPTEFARWAIIAALCFTLAWAAASDIRDRRIPNWTVLAVAGLYAGWVFAGKAVSIVSSVEAALIVFVASCALYAFRLVGAGDSKLATVVALFVGLRLLPLFLLVMSVIGGGLAILSLVSRPTRTLALIQTGGRGDRGRGIPYGVAIALSGIFLVVRTGI